MSILQVEHISKSFGNTEVLKDVSYPLEEGALDACLEAGVKAIIVGHDHNNNWIIRHKGIRFVFSLKTGPGCYWQPELNGGTVIKITSQGIEDIYHEYVTI